MVHANEFLASLAQRMELETGTRLGDWIDHFAIRLTDAETQSLCDLGYTERETGRLENRLGMFPDIYRLANGAPLKRIGIKVDSVSDFVQANNLNIIPHGSAGGQFRFATCSQDGGVEVQVVERHGWRTHEPINDSRETIDAAKRHLRLFQSRQRSFDDDSEGFAHARRLIAESIKDIGRDWTCDLFFQAERDYWQSRNQAARTQFTRQNTLGLGWGNHDHHTYRSSRVAFHRLVAILEQLGFACREQFYAGHDAGWGAQVMEQSICGITVFADVDLTPEEIQGDIAHEPLTPSDELGTVGLWCCLHGEAFLEAGMHHLECQFSFDAARSQLGEMGVASMTPFTDFPFLRQSFTEPERWEICPDRISVALDCGYITEDQAESFAKEGAPGSHLEVLERNDGYKGFNQSGISDIIKRTDPRRG